MIESSVKVVKRIFKNNIFRFIFTILILSIGTTFAYSVFAENVGFTSTHPGWSAPDVKEAIDDLRYKITDKCYMSAYDLKVTTKPSASMISFVLDNSDENFIYMYCGLNGNFQYESGDGVCKIPNVEPNMSYVASVIGVDKDMNLKRRDILVKTNPSFIFTTDFLSSGSTQGSVVVTSGNPDGTPGLSITGTSDLYNYQNQPRSVYLAHYRKWYKDIDLSKYNVLTFYARKSANHGNVMIGVDDDELLYVNYSVLDTNWIKYEIDIAKYVGVHKLTLAGGYSDYTGSPSSNTQYYHIEFR